MLPPDRLNEIGVLKRREIEARILLQPGHPADAHVDDHGGRAALRLPVREARRDGMKKGAQPPSSAPPIAAITTTSHGATRQNISRPNATRASPKSAWPVIALVHTGS